MNAESTSTSLRHVVLGNPENRRVAFFQQALARRNQPPARVVSYQQLLTGSVSCTSLFQQSDVLRIESPGENFDVERLLIARGAAPAAGQTCQQIDAAEALTLQPDRGRLRFVRQWYLGFADLLNELDHCWRQHPQVRLYNAPSDIQVMFDKCACQRLLADRGVPVPPRLGPIGNFDELEYRARQHCWNRVFVKLAHGSSASGVVAIHRHRHGIRAVSTMEMVRRRGCIQFYNHLRPHTYTQLGEVRRLIDFVCRESAQVERWLPKASLGPATFDLRIVVVGGCARHAVVRTSRGILTNLHLGNRRGDLAALIRRLGAAKWEQVRQTAAAAYSTFSTSTYAGIDLLLTPGFHETTVLEANAFGDLLPGVVQDGEDTYGAELGEQLRRFSRETQTR